MKALRLRASRLAARLAMVVCVFLTSAATASAKDELLIFSASSLTDVMSKIGSRYTGETGVEVRFSFAGTGQLARQIEAGAPADVFVSADPRWMEWALEKTALDPRSVKAFAGNRLIVAVRNETENWADISGLLTGNRFAMGDPDSVPAGRYAKQALTAQGLWETAKDKAAYGENVRVVLRRLALGEVGAAIVYETDVRAEAGVRAIHTFPQDTHDTIAYSAAVLADRPKAAEDFVTYLSGEDARAILKEYGFKLPAVEH